MPVFATTMLGVLISVLGQANPLAQNEALALRAVTPNQTSVPCYGKYELRLDLAAAYDNPFDPGDIDVWAVFTAPGGQSTRVNGFLGQDFTRSLENGHEVIALAGAPQWIIRFAPNTEGRWNCVVHAKDRTGQVESSSLPFDATASGNPGYVRCGKKNPLGFAFDNGQPLFLVGENMCWSWPANRGSFDYDDWLALLSKNGGNWIRIWMSSWNCGLEWSGEGFHGVGAYNLSNAWKLDAILDLAEQNGVYTMLCFGTYGEFTTGGIFNEGQWNQNPYNSANGGPCAKPADFWRDEQARKLYQRRLRYLAARYGWRTGIHAWEFWNEAHAPSPWVEEMAQYLKGTDPFGHLVSTTYGNPKIWRLQNIDFTMTHHYGKGDIPDSAPVIHDDAEKHREYGKPHLMAEFGIDYRSSDQTYDPQYKGVNLHNGLWSSALSGNAGGAMLWYWDCYVHPGNLYGQFAALSRFVKDVPWADGAWEALETDAPSVPKATGHRDMTMSPSCGWEKCSKSKFTLDPNQGANGALPEFLYSPGKAELRIQPGFTVHFEEPGRFELRVEKVSGTATLHFLLDGVLASEVKFNAAPPSDPNVKPDYESTEFKQEYGIYQARFDKTHGIEVPAGEHTVALEVTDGDWLSVSNYTLKGYTSNRFPKMNVYGLHQGGRALLWLQNAASHWKNTLDQKEVAPIQGASTVVHGLPGGEYTVEWWDTWKGEITRSETAVCQAGDLPLHLPEIASDVAAKLTLH